MGILECGSSSKGCHHLWCEPKWDTQSMESPTDVWISYQCHAGGRQRPTTPIQDRCLVVQAIRHPFVNATTLRNELRNAVGVNISTQKVHNSLQRSGLRSRRECVRIPLTRLHKQVRLNWTRDHVNWTDNDWDPVLFTDE